MNPLQSHPQLRAQHLRGILYALAGFGCWVVADVFMKLSVAASTPLYEIIAIGTVSGMLSIVAFTLLTGVRDQLRPQRIDLLSILGVLFSVTQFMYLFAIGRMPLATYYIIIFLSPVLLAVFSAVFLRERLAFAQGVAVLCGFAGVVIAVDPFSIAHGSIDSWSGYAAAGVGVLCFTVQMLMIRILGRSDTRIAVALYPRLGPFLVSLVALAIFGVKPMPLEIVCCAIALGAIGGIGWVLIAQAYKLAPIGIIAPFQYSEIIFGAFAGYYIWGNVPSLQLIIGGIIIIGSGLYLLRHTHRGTHIRRS